MTRAAVASDLDRTLIFSVNAAGGDVGDALCVEVYDGKPLSYMSLQAVETVAPLVSDGLLVPVTTRTREQFRRIRLPGGPPRFAVCANGGRLLVDDVDDLEYEAVVAERVGADAPLAEVLADFETWCAGVPETFGGGIPRVRSAEGLFCYAVFPRQVATDDELLGGLTALLAAARWRLSVQGRKVYAVPGGLSKWSALEHLEQRFDLRFVLTAGDSHLDADMLLGVGAGLVPRDSELHRSGWTAPGVELTERTGLEAGEDVALRLAEVLATAG